MPVRLSPLLDPAPDAILVGDPRRAFALGKSLTVQPKMSHLARGLWGYTGVTETGHSLTVQSTGIGGPSAVAVIADLAELGVRRMVRLGTCVATEASEPGAAFLISRAFSGDGAARALTGGAESVWPDPELTEALEGVAEWEEVYSHDLVQRFDRASSPTGPAPLRDLQTAATFAAARELEIGVAAILVVAENSVGRRLDEPQLEAIFEPLGRSVTHALQQ